jgi:hypothetical protein
MRARMACSSSRTCAAPLLASSRLSRSRNALMTASVRLSPVRSASCWASRSTSGCLMLSGHGVYTGRNLGRYVERCDRWQEHEVRHAARVGGTLAVVDRLDQASVARARLVLPSVVDPQVGRRSCKGWAIIERSRFDAIYSWLKANCKNLATKITVGLILIEPMRVIVFRHNRIVEDQCRCTPAFLQSQEPKMYRYGDTRILNKP